MDRNRRSCKTSANSFCYVCGELTFKSQRRSITHNVKKAYYLYFGCKVGEQDKNWAPHVCCVTCYVKLTEWLWGKNNSMSFAVPMIWGQPTSHLEDCYFCITKTEGFSRKSKDNIVYPNLPSAIRPVLHSPELPVPIPLPSREDYVIPVEDEVSESSDCPSTSADPAYVPQHHKQPHMIRHTERNDLVRDLGLSKQHAELLGSRLQEWNLLAEDTKISVFRKRNEKLTSYFAMENSVCACKNVNGLMDELDIEYNPEEWRLFINSSKLSLKAVLLHHGNTKPSIPVAHSVAMKETYENMSIILNAVNYNEHRWTICGDLKVIALLLGLQGGFTKFCCFLCLWDS